MKDLIKNYIYIVSKIKNEIKKEINDEKDDWIKLELNSILESLNKKLEKKIIFDINNELDGKDEDIIPETEKNEKTPVKTQEPVEKQDPEEKEKIKETHQESEKPEKMEIENEEKKEETKVVETKPVFPETPDNLRLLIVDCLGLLKCLQVEGDIDLDKNGFYLRLLKKISRTFGEDNSNKKMHNFSNTLFKIIDKLKESA